MIRINYKQKRLFLVYYFVLCLEESIIKLLTISGGILYSDIFSGKGLTLSVGSSGRTTFGV